MSMVQRVVKHNSGDIDFQGSPGGADFSSHLLSHPRISKQLSEEIRLGAEQKKPELLLKTFQGVRQSRTYGSLLKAMHRDGDSVALALRNENGKSVHDIEALDVMVRFWHEQERMFCNYISKPLDGSEDAHTSEEVYNELRSLYANSRLGDKEKAELISDVRAHLDRCDMQLSDFYFAHVFLSYEELPVVIVDFVFMEEDREMLHEWRQEFEEEWQCLLCFKKDLHANRKTEQELARIWSENRIVLEPDVLMQLLEKQSDDESQYITSESQTHNYQGAAPLYNYDVNRHTWSYDAHNREGLHWTEKPEDIFSGVALPKERGSGFFTQVWVPDYRHTGVGYCVGREVPSLSIACLHREDGELIGHELSLSVARNHARLEQISRHKPDNVLDIGDSFFACKQAATMLRAKRLGIEEQISLNGHSVVAELMHNASLCFVKSFIEHNEPLPLIGRDNRFLQSSHLGELSRKFHGGIADGVALGSILFQLVQDNCLDEAEELVRHLDRTLPYVIIDPTQDVAEGLQARFKGNTLDGRNNQIQAFALKSNSKGLSYEEQLGAVRILNARLYKREGTRFKRTFKTLARMDKLFSKRGSHFAALIRRSERYGYIIDTKHSDAALRTSGMLRVDANKHPRALERGQLVEVRYEGYNPFRLMHEFSLSENAASPIARVHDGYAIY